MEGSEVRVRWVFLPVVAWLCGGCGLDTQTTPRQTSYQGNVACAEEGSRSGCGSVSERNLFFCINEERKRAGLPPLQWSNGLADLARAHAHDMCERGFFDHVNPEGQDPTARANSGRAGRFAFRPLVPDVYPAVAENIAYGYRSASAVVRAWMNSPGHRANVLSSRWTHVGCGNCGSTGANARESDSLGCGMHWVATFAFR